MIYSRYLAPYIEDIQSGRINHCADQDNLMKNVLLPVLARDDVYVDDDKIEEGLKLQKYFDYNLLEWEIFLFAAIVGIRFKERKNIYFTDWWICLGRGSGKNGFLSYLIFYFLSPAHGIKNYDIDLLANSEAQVKTSFMDIHDIITDPVDPGLKRTLDHNFHTTLETITGLKTQSTLYFNTSSKRGKDSKRTGCIMLDEVHEYLDFTNVNTLKSGLGKRPDGRCITITTFGHVRGAVFDRQLEQMEDILSAYNPDNRTFPFICRIESEDEWNKPECWIKAIPSIDDFHSLRERIQKEVVDMPYTPEYRSEFLTKRMNFPVGNAETEVASWEDITATNRPLPDLTGWPCVGGLDYAKTNDFVAAVLLFLVGDELCVIQHTWVCNESRDLPGIKAPLTEWAERGDLEFVEAPEVPPEYVAEWFAAQAENYTILSVGVDTFRFAVVRSALNAVGIGAGEDYRVPIKLTRKSDIIKVFPVVNSAFVTHKFVWGDLPILRWYTNNTKVVAEGINFNYAKIEPCFRKTDGFMALVHAMTQIDILDNNNGTMDIIAPIIL